MASNMLCQLFSCKIILIGTCSYGHCVTILTVWYSILVILAVAYCPTVAIGVLYDEVIHMFCTTWDMAL